MQKHLILLSSTIILSLFTAFFNALNANDLELADSLFAQKKYTQAFEIYDSLYHIEGQISEKMLLRMSFIKEGLNDYTNAIYFLNKYYDISHDPKVIEKIKELAEAHQLKGYQYGDQAFFKRILNEYRFTIAGVLSAIAILLLGRLVFVRIKQNRKSIASLAFLILLSASVYAIFLMPDFDKKGILKDETLVYTLPSSGSEVIEKAEKGRLVEILDEIDVWTVIRNGENVAYVKTGNVRKL